MEDELKRKNNDGFCRIKTKIMQLFNRKTQKTQKIVLQKENLYLKIKNFV